LSQNEGNLRAALSWATDAGQIAEQAELGLQIGLVRGRRGYRAQAVAPVQDGLDTLAPSREQYPKLYLELLCERAGLALEVETAEDAAKRAAEAQNWAEAIGDVEGIGQAENLRGRAALDTGDYARARLYFEAARTWAQAVGNAVLEAIALNNLALCERRDGGGDHTLAEEYLQTALHIRRAQDDARGIAETLTNLGVLAYSRQDWNAAHASYTEALTLHQQLDHLYGMAILLFNLSEIAVEQGEGVRACRLCAASERLLREIGSSEVDAVSLYLVQIAETTCLIAEECRREADAPPLGDVTEWAVGGDITPPIPRTYPIHSTLD
jgi:tetratricopeptide (TPR) repeat protein